MSSIAAESGNMEKSYRRSRKSQCTDLLIAARTERLS